MSFRILNSSFIHIGTQLRGLLQRPEQLNHSQIPTCSSFLGQEMRRDFLPTCWRNLLKERRATITSFRGKGSQAQRTIRATGQPDFSVDGGAAPVDLTEELRPAIVKEADFSVTRRGVGVVWQFLYVVSCIMVFMKCVSLDASFLADMRVWNLAGRDMLLVRVASRPL